MMHTTATNEPVSIRMRGRVGAVVMMSSTLVLQLLPQEPQFLLNFPKSSITAEAMYRESYDGRNPGR